MEQSTQLVEWRWFVDSSLTHVAFYMGQISPLIFGLKLYSCSLDDSSNETVLPYRSASEGRREIFGYHHNVVAEQVDLSSLLSL